MHYFKKLTYNNGATTVRNKHLSGAFFRHQYIDNQKITSTYMAIDDYMRINYYKSGPEYYEENMVKAYGSDRFRECESQDDSYYCYTYEHTSVLKLYENGSLYYESTSDCGLKAYIVYNETKAKGGSNRSPGICSALPNGLYKNG